MGHQMKTLKDRFCHLLPAFPNDKVMDNAEEFIGDVLSSYIKQANFLKKEIKNILIKKNLYTVGMSDEQMINILKTLAE